MNIVPLNPPIAERKPKIFTTYLWVKMIVLLSWNAILYCGIVVLFGLEFDTVISLNVSYVKNYSEDDGYVFNGFGIILS